MFRHFHWLFFSVMLFTVAQGKDFAGAEIYVNDAVRYGRFDARMQMGAVSGSVSSMFLYYNDSYLKTEPWHEIDYEVLGKEPEKIQTNLITALAGEKNKTSEEHHDLSSRADQTWHTYSIIWTPDYISWLVDGNEVRRSTGAQVTHLQGKDMNLRFNLWASTTTAWTGIWYPERLPAYQYLNWVQYSAYTPGAGPEGSDFSLVWRDDFDGDALNSERWSLANWTFDGNRVDFTPKNAVVSNGALVLCLTSMDALGFDGSPIPQDINGTTAGIRQPFPSPKMIQMSQKFNLKGQTIHE